MAAMTDVERFLRCFKEELEAFTFRVHAARVVDAEAFERLNADSHKVAEELKGRMLVPKFLLHAMRSAVKILQAEAPYMPEKRDAMLDMAHKLEVTFDLILMGEDHSNRIPGVPRII